MATLVLTTVGGAIGGPVGAALGGVIGQAVDRGVLLVPKARQGPRLSDLKVQTSSYGTPIPKVFGTMRVAGCVIWATDLIETRSTSRGGKGQPGVTGYSYAASFAVALSARPIAGVGRIWAEGKLLRGAAGDWKTPTGFRLHRGGEGQAPDPLIAALEPETPAYRGLAYAVFENLALADFGNRIPSLTFEVIGDAAAPSVGAVARALGGGAITGDGPAAALHGYAASGESVAGALDTLATIAGAWLVPDGGAMRLDDRPGAAVVLDDDVAVREVRRPIETVPRTLSLSCYDPERDYQIGVQQARRPDGAGWRAEALDVAAVLPAARARGVVQAALRRAEAERVTRRVTLDATALALGPGQGVRLPGVTGAWRVTRADLEGAGVTLELVPVAAGAVDVPADAGRALPAPDVQPAATLLEAAELPPLDEGQPGVMQLAIFASGAHAGWRGAALLVSGDGGAWWDAAGRTAAPAVMGSVTRAIDAGSAMLRDTATVVEVLLAHDDMTLASVSEGALDRGANLALLGDELLQFRDAVQVAPRRWWLSLLLRGRRGSAALRHAAGARFVLLTPETMVTVPLPRSRPGETVRLLAQGVGDAAPVEARVVLSGASVAPPSPVRLRVEAATLRWGRRSRFGWRWDDDGDVPLGEEQERYAVTVMLPGGERGVTTEAPYLALPPGATGVAVRQAGTFALSRAVERTIVGDGQ